MISFTMVRIMAETRSYFDRKFLKKLIWAKIIWKIIMQLLFTDKPANSSQKKWLIKFTEKMKNVVDTPGCLCYNIDCLKKQNIAGVVQW